MKTQHELKSSKKLNVTQTIINEGENFNTQQNHSYSPNLVNKEKVPSNYYSMQTVLASKFIFYPYKDLHIRPLNVEDIFQINYGHNLGSFRPIAQAMSNCIYEQDINVFELTFADAKQLLHWLKLNSYFKLDFMFDAICLNIEHQERIANGELNVESLLNKGIIIRDTNLEIDVINSDLSDKAFNAMLEKYKLEFIPMTFGMFIELEELKEEYLNATGLDNPDLDDLNAEHKTTLYIAEFAKYLSSIYGESLKEKIEFFRLLSVPPSILQDILDYEKVTHHSIVEQVKTTCKECGGDIVTNLSIDPRTFFPEL